MITVVVPTICSPSRARRSVTAGSATIACSLSIVGTGSCGLSCGSRRASASYTSGVASVTASMLTIVGGYKRRGRKGRRRIFGAQANLSSRFSAAALEESEHCGGGGRACDHDEEGGAQHHHPDRPDQRRPPHIHHQVMNGGEGLRRDQRGEERDPDERNGALHACVLQHARRQRESGQFQRVARGARDQHAGPHHRPDLTMPKIATRTATMSSGTPAGRNGRQTSATTPAPSAMASGPRAPRRGRRAGSKAAGGAAPKPSTLGSGSACVASAPTRVPRFHSV